MYLSKNPTAIDLLKENPDKIDWGWLSSNPAIFELDKEKYKINCNIVIRKLRNIKF